MKHERTLTTHSPSWFGVPLACVALAGTLVLFQFSYSRPDSPITFITPGSSASPSFAVQIIRPREGLPLGGLLPPKLFGVDAQLGFDSDSFAATYRFTNEALHLSSANWDLRIALDVAKTSS